MTHYQCHAITKAGHRCSRSRVSGNFCGQHQPDRLVGETYVGRRARHERRQAERARMQIEDLEEQLPLMDTVASATAAAVREAIGQLRHAVEAHEEAERALMRAEEAS